MTMKIKITYEERQVFDQLLSIIKENNLDLILRVTGSWVINKMMDYFDNEDSELKHIDIYIDEMLGYEFVKLMKEGTYKSIKDLRSNLGDYQTEMCVISINNYQITFVNNVINKERLATLTEELNFKRFTINQIYYNINDDEIEDITGDALNDLYSKRLSVTHEFIYEDDPGLLMKAINYASKYGFIIDDKIKSVKTNFLTKRMIAIHTNDILLAHKYGINSLKIMNDLGLFKEIFDIDTDQPTISSALNRITPEVNRWNKIVKIDRVGHRLFYCVLLKSMFNMKDIIFSKEICKKAINYLVDWNDLLNKINDPNIISNNIAKITMNVCSIDNWQMNLALYSIINDRYNDSLRLMNKIKEYAEANKLEIPAPLLDGHEINYYKLVDGFNINNFKELLTLLQIEGKVTNKEEAIGYFIKKN